MSHKKDRMKTAKLSSTVLDYYYKYGQNRDIEKYFRLKRQSTSKSSSDSSLKNYTTADSNASDGKRFTKSMDKLEFSDRKSQYESDAEQSKATKHTENMSDSADAKSKSQPKSNEPERIKIEKKTQQQWKSKSKSKSYNLNLESSIEINLPTTSSMPALPITQVIDSISNPNPNRMLRLESCETQTDDAFLMKPVPSTSMTEQTPAPPPLSQQTPASAVDRKSDRIKATPENVQETSPASSVASAKVRLEWDSMADIGYNRIIDFKSQSNSNLTAFERSALIKFFARRGLNFDENLVILAPAAIDKKSPLQKHEFTQSAIEMRDAHKIRKDLPKLSPSTNKQLWERALVKYREKYGKMRSPTGTRTGTSSIDTTQFIAPHHSTPLPGELSKTTQFHEDCESEATAKSSKKVSEQVKEVQRIEKWCQTSSVDVEAIGIQVEQPEIHYATKSVQIEIEHVHESTQKDDEDLTTATSFEFLAPNTYAQQQQRLIQQNPPKPSTSAIIQHQNRSKCHEFRNESVYVQNEDPDDKENIPPIDEKENIPPSALHRNDQLPVFKTPEPSIDQPNDSTVLPNDLQKGVDLINALIDSRTTDRAAKKKLIRKIIRHLVQSRDAKDITHMIMSYSDKSNSKISGVSMLTDMENDENAKCEATGKDTISGVSTLSSSSSNGTVSGVEPIESPLPSQQNITDQNQEERNRVDAQTESKQANDDEMPPKNNEKQEKVIKEWLRPVTQSEIEKELFKKLQSVQLVPTFDTNEPAQIVDGGDDDGKMHKPHDTESDKKLPKSGLFEFLENEKKTHYNWIDQEIEHLKKLKLLMQHIEPSESDGSKGDISDEKINSVYAKPNRNYLTIYENFRRSRKRIDGNGSQADVSSTLIDSSKSSNDDSRCLNHVKMGSKSHWIHKTTLESPPSTISSGSKLKQNSVEFVRGKTFMQSQLPEWDSHLNMQQLVKNRTKLKTPNTDESTEAHEKASRSQFNRKHIRKSSAEEKRTATTKMTAHDQPIYTKPYSSDSYSDIVPNAKHSNQEDRLNKEKKSDIADGYTSVTGSDGFLSPNSISIDVAANSTSNTTTHQYDTKISIGLQTTNTLERMPIIQMKHPNEMTSEPVVPQPIKPITKRVSKFTLNKQLQVRPESLAYIIVFKDDANADQNANSKWQEHGNRLYANSNKLNLDSKRNDNSDHSSLAATTDHHNHDVDDEQNEETKSNGNSSLSTSFENLTLQEYLQTRRPDFYVNAEQRRKCLKNLHNLRQQRNEQRKKLLAMSISSNAKMLNRNMKRLLPPPPLAQMRIFKSKEIISQTRRKYQKLPEIRQRKQFERDMKIRRNQRILVNVFSKNLQKHVLSGNTDLSNSMIIN